MNTYSVNTSHIVAAGTKRIDALAFRKCRRLSCVTLPDGLLTIGDAAFSLCTSLQQIQIPASVERIRVAAFCMSGLVTIQFQGIPKVIETDVFKDCKQLKEIVVPVGSSDVFIRKFGLPKDKVVEGRGYVQVPRQEDVSSLQAHRVDSPNPKTVKRIIRFSYNACYFNWAIGDEVDLKHVFSGPITLTGNLTYEFRRKVLFIFVKSATARTLKSSVVYELPTNTATFARKYQDKYANRSPCIFLFVCDDSRTAKFFDEVKLMRINANSIVVKSLLKV